MNNLTRWLKYSDPSVRRDVHRYGMTLCAGALMPFVPGRDLGTAVFVLAYGWLLLAGNGFKTSVLPELRRRGLWICLFLTMCASSVFWLIRGGGDPAQWARAIIPFVFLLSWFHLPSLRQAESEALARWLLLATCVWAVKIVLQACWLALQGSDVFSVRLTTRVTDSVLPYPLIALTLLLFVRTLTPRVWRRILVAALSLLYVWIGYRGGLVIMMAMIALWLLVARGNSVALLLALLLGPLLVILGHSLAESFGVAGDLASRFSSIGEERGGSRALEWLYALGQWAQSPLIGKGLGWQVPGEVTFFGVDDPDIERPETVGYVHSAIAYFLMDLGLVGTLLYFLSITPGLPRVIELRRGRLEAAIALALWLLIAFFLTQASFRQVQTTMVLMAALKIHLSLKATAASRSRSLSVAAPSPT